MIRIDSTYSEYFDSSDEKYPYGKAVDASTEDSSDGTEYKVRWMNDVIGAFSALFYRAFGKTTRKPLNEPDNIERSDIADAVVQLIETASISQWHKIDVQSAETVIPWEELGKTYNTEKSYTIIATPNGNYTEFLPIGTEAKEDGVHIYIRRLVDGTIADGTRQITWGTFVFGERLFGEFETMTINLFVKEFAA
ncbi:MAG: hypothetical protein IJ191_01835 [Treponema sp.]|nr:hypothetical protein [Treponema sp.]